jgi:hypothetical protein
MNRTLNVSVRDVDDKHKVDLGAFNIEDVQPLIELYKLHGAYLVEGGTEFVGAQMLPEKMTVEIVMQYS